MPDLDDVMDDEEDEQPHELTGLDVREISLVNRAANKRRFLLFKDRRGAPKVRAGERGREQTMDLDALTDEDIRTMAKQIVAARSERTVTPGRAPDLRALAKAGDLEAAARQLDEATYLRYRENVLTGAYDEADETPPAPADLEKSAGEGTALQTAIARARQRKAQPAIDASAIADELSRDPELYQAYREQNYAE